MAGLIDPKHKGLEGLGWVAELERGFATWTIELLGIEGTGLELGLGVGVVMVGPLFPLGSLAP
jgi:hypothetical protein